MEATMPKLQRVTYFKITLEDKPGALLRVAKDLKSKKVGLVGLKAYASQPGQSVVHLIAKNPDKLRDTLKSLGVTAEEGTVYFVKGADRTGALVKSLEALAHAGVNIMATDAMAVGGNYGSFFRVAPADADKTTKALGAK
jgi:hypothetical protein